MSFEHDSVIDFTPITFAGTFVRKMRDIKGLANIPSIRTTIAIPQFLSARYWRQEKLDPMDYVQAAVYNTPYEDQTIAYKIAYQLLFPRQFEPKTRSSEIPDKSKKKKKQTKQHKQESDKPQLSGLDQILDELSSAGFDDLLDAMDNDTDLDDMMAQQQTAWEFLDQLLQSSDPLDTARLDLLQDMESEYSIVQHQLDSRDLIDSYISQLLAQLAGTWSPEIFEPATAIGMQEQLLRQAQMPWEQAAAMTAASHPDTQHYLQDMLQQDAHTLGTTLRYLSELGKSPSPQWQNQAFEQIKTMTDYYAMLRGMQQFRDPPAMMLEQAVNNMAQAMKLAEQIDTEFGNTVQKQLFDQFLKQSAAQPPSVQQVQDATFDDGQQSWEKLLSLAVQQASEKSKASQLTELAKSIARHDSPQLSAAMRRHQTKLAKEVGTQSMEQITTAEQFMPELDHLLQHQIQPEFQRVLNAGTNLGISEEEIAEMYQGALQLLQAYIETDSRKRDNYDRVVRQLVKQPSNSRGRYQPAGSIPMENMQQMMQQAVTTMNAMAMAALGAVDMGQAMRVVAGIAGQVGQQMLAEALDKGIGGGTNLLQQWFLHRHNLPSHLKHKLKEMMRETLLEIGMDWANRGTGSSEEGIIPVNTTRPYRPGDELDLIDIEATLDTLMMSGKTLEQITEDELIVTETSKGKTALGVLIDISGSMSGKDLAMCAIAVVMLLGKLEGKEVAIALFESDTHVIKGFEDEIGLDQVADELLDLRATGGTRADAALRWIADEFDHVPDAEVKILYFLSDFYLTEQQQQLTLLCDPMSSQGVKILAAYHSSYDRQRMNHMIELLDGSSMEIKDFENLPKVLAESIENLQ